MKKAMFGIAPGTLQSRGQSKATRDSFCVQDPDSFRVQDPSPWFSRQKQTGKHMVGVCSIIISQIKLFQAWPAARN